MLTVSGAATMHARTRFPRWGAAPVDRESRRHDARPARAGTLLGCLERHPPRWLVSDDCQDQRAVYRRGVGEFSAQSIDVDRRRVVWKLLGTTWRTAHKWLVGDRRRKAKGPSEGTRFNGFRRTAIVNASGAQPRADEMVGLSACEMVRRIADGRLTSAELVERTSPHRGGESPSERGRRAAVRTGSGRSRDGRRGSQTR